jgi:hypothetical protein
MKMTELSKINPSRLTLKGWAALDDLKKQIGDSTNSDIACNFILQSIELAIDERPDWDEAFWLDVTELFIKTSIANQPTIPFPILTSKAKGDSLPWEYAGRSWFFWLNVFAKRYGWDESSIAALDIDTAVALYQEITVDEQTQREWEWGLSENSISYNSATKKSRFVPLERPDWMAATAKPRKVVKMKIRADMMPNGNIINLDLDE